MYNFDNPNTPDPTKLFNQMNTAIVEMMQDEEAAFIVTMQDDSGNVIKDAFDADGIFMWSTSTVAGRMPANLEPEVMAYIQDDLSLF